MNHALLPKTANANLPASYEAAKHALAECNRIDECKDWADKAQALASYARQSEDKELETTATRIRARAIRRCGELLKEIEKASGGKPFQNPTRGSAPPSRKQAATEAGLSPDQSKQAIRVANVPQETFTDQVESDNPPTITQLAAQGIIRPMEQKMAQGIPVYEQLGMTKEEFQAGMYFRGHLEDFIKVIRKYDPEHIAKGSNETERAEIRAAIQEIDTFNDKLVSKL